MTRGRVNIGASVSARLLNRAHQTGDDFQVLLASFGFERFLYRLGISGVQERFVLKGAMLLRLWTGQPYRATRDLDLLRRGGGSLDVILGDLQVVCETTSEPDGISFDAGAIRIEPIRSEEEYAGARAVLPTRCGSARLSLQVDIGTGDAVWPAPRPRTYPTLLEFPAPQVLAYPLEAVVAEKFDAMVVLGDRNSRIKDFFDLEYLARNFPFDRMTLAEAVRRTFKTRRTPIPEETPFGLTITYWENPSRSAQVRAFARRARLTVPEDHGRIFTELLSEFLLPILDDLRDGRSREGSWIPGGSWIEKGLD